MFIKKNLNVPNNLGRLYSRNTQFDYEIPERYRNSFYLANAAFFDSTNWFLHRAFEAIFPKLHQDYLKNAKDCNELDAFEKLNNIINVLDQCNSIIDVRFPIKREKTGAYELVRGFRAHYGQSTGLPSSIGGLRICKTITRDQMKALAVLTSYKNHCMGIGFSGAHGGIKISPAEYTENELQDMTEKYVFELYKKGYCGFQDVMYPDINTSDREMAWVSKSFANYSGQKMNIAATGLSFEGGGIESFEKAGPYGAYLALNMFLENDDLMSKINLEKGISKKTFIIQGLGKMGKHLAQLLHKNGAICVGVKEFDHFMYDPEGINLDELFEHKEKHGTIENYGMVKNDDKLEKIYTEKCDILVLAGHHKSLVCHVARNVKAKVILEAADGPVTPTSHRILVAHQKLVIPDIYVCAGANVASYLEYLRNWQRFGLYDHTVLRYSNGMYNSIIQNSCSSDSKIISCGYTANDIDNLEFIIDEKTMKSSLDVVFTEIGQEILKNLNDHNLGTEVRTAAYITAIKNIFKIIFNTGKFIA